ncbi:RNA 2',3'-cyclic phosphodiesterase [Pseudomonas sp. UBA2684]|uniref:RNA 2',3'-cyclic phosphodiesterase n=1 Tax=Pseudomonas sp. UBA2684 TaxID=1947311 RepID=UPI000E7D89A2|nr:RNA 2',3'-cyclic phosphodiesterase [Pseudomonas sp. UBA2684]HBX57984.1 RNA 2',3'-cyclic phosphodiesterase [Pseudomonas sp.]|tara:strand:- start:473 stop:997 length:525 start_codon:yes stop_codon:yes gene_type:complete
MKADVLRLFFALRCPAELASEIVAWRDALPVEGRALTAANLHLTLAFLGQQPRARVNELQELAARVEAAAFTLHLDQLGRLKNGLLFLAPSRPPAALLALAQALRDELRTAGIPLESRAFKPHLSLLRHCPWLPLDATPSFDWPSTHFALFSSRQSARGSHYQQLEQWPLRTNE